MQLFSVRRLTSHIRSIKPASLWNRDCTASGYPVYHIALSISLPDTYESKGFRVLWDAAGAFKEA